MQDPYELGTSETRLPVRRPPCASVRGVQIVRNAYGRANLVRGRRHSGLMGCPTSWVSYRRHRRPWIRLTPTRRCRLRVGASLLLVSDSWVSSLSAGPEVCGRRRACREPRRRRVGHQPIRRETARKAEGFPRAVARALWVAHAGELATIAMARAPLRGPGDRGDIVHRSPGFCASSSVPGTRQARTEMAVPACRDAHRPITSALPSEVRRVRFGSPRATRARIGRRRGRAPSRIAARCACPQSARAAR